MPEESLIVEGDIDEVIKRIKWWLKINKLEPGEWCPFEPTKKNYTLFEDDGSEEMTQLLFEASETFSDLETDVCLICQEIAGIDANMTCPCFVLENSEVIKKAKAFIKKHETEKRHALVKGLTCHHKTGEVRIVNEIPYRSKAKLNEDYDMVRATIDISKHTWMQLKRRLQVKQHENT